MGLAPKGDDCWPTGVYGDRGSEPAADDDDEAAFEKLEGDFGDCSELERRVRNLLCSAFSNIGVSPSAVDAPLDRRVVLAGVPPGLRSPLRC